MTKLPCYKFIWKSKTVYSSMWRKTSARKERWVTQNLKPPTHNLKWLRVSRISNMIAEVKLCWSEMRLSDNKRVRMLGLSLSLSYPFPVNLFFMMIQNLLPLFLWVITVNNLSKTLSYWSCLKSDGKMGLTIYCTHEGYGKKGVCMGICSRREKREENIEKKWW